MKFWSKFYYHSCDLEKQRQLPNTNNPNTNLLLSLLKAEEFISSRYTDLQHNKKQ